MYQHQFHGYMLLMKRGKGGTRKLAREMLSTRQEGERGTHCRGLPKEGIEFMDPMAAFCSNDRFCLVGHFYVIFLLDFGLKGSTSVSGIEL